LKIDPGSASDPSFGFRQDIAPGRLEKKVRWREPNTDGAPKNVLTLLLNGRIAR
jgi:hypothetical protein